MKPPAQDPPLLAHHAALQVFTELTPGRQRVRLRADVALRWPSAQPFMRPIAGQGPAGPVWAGIPVLKEAHRTSSVIQILGKETASEGRDPASPCLGRAQPSLTGEPRVGDSGLELLASPTQDSPTTPGPRGQGPDGQRKPGQAEMRVVVGRGD